MMRSNPEQQHSSLLLVKDGHQSAAGEIVAALDDFWPLAEPIELMGVLERIEGRGIVIVEIQR